MNDESELDETNFLDPEWNRAWYHLRNAGWPDFAIWDMVASVDDAGWPEDPPPGRAKEYYYVELIHNILDLRQRVLNEDRPPHEWVLDGLGIGLSLFLADDDSSQKQRTISRRPRKRITIGRTVVEHVLGFASPDEKSYTFFEQYVGADCRLDIDGNEIGVIATSDEKGKVIKFGFEEPGAAKPEWYLQGSIRSIISRLNNPIIKNYFALLLKPQK